MFAEIYNPYLSQDHEFGGIKPMDPYVRREVLSHLGYQRLDFPYVHPSWQGDGKRLAAWTCALCRVMSRLVNCRPVWWLIS